jgi:hypothetical protein
MSTSPRKSLALFSSLALLTGLIIWSQLPTARAEAIQDARPAVGDTIDLKSWTDRKGRTLADVNGKQSLALVAFVAPNCDACLKSKDDMESLRQRAAKANIAYYVLMIPQSTDVQSYFAYADSLKIGAEAFVWSNSDAKPPVSLTTMAGPLHLMVTNEGLVANKWPGVPSSVSTQ